MSTYRDGVDVERCSSCHTALRAKDGEPLVSLPLRFAEELAMFMGLGITGHPGSFVDRALTQLEQVCGRSLMQIEQSVRDAREQSEVITGQTDRGGLLLDAVDPSGGSEGKASTRDNSSSSVSDQAAADQPQRPANEQGEQS